jgi:hypothetical protein
MIEGVSKMHVSTPPIKERVSYPLFQQKFFVLCHVDAIL